MTNYLIMILLHIFSILVCIGSSYSYGAARLNLFNPYDILLHPRLMPPGTHCVSAAFEAAVDQRGFQDNLGPDCTGFRRRCNILQLWQDQQDGLAAFKGSQFYTNIGQTANLFSHDDDAGNQALFIPYGTLSAQNVMLTYQYQWSDTTSWAFYMPIVRLALHDVHFKELKNENFFESNFTNNFLKTIENVGKISFSGWSKTGISDLTTLVWWERGFPQIRPLLSEVTLRLRGGFTIPMSGRSSCEDRFFEIPLSYDASWGILGGGTIEFRYTPHVGLGIDAEMLNLFGSIKNRRVKTDSAQTDLFFISGAETWRDPGFVQHYTIWGSAFITPFLTLRIAYQYFKQQDDQLFVASNSIDAEIANSAESLLEWTTNSAVFQLYYEVPRKNDARLYPRIGAWYKLGFNGKRAILADTLGISIDMAF